MTKRFLIVAGAAVAVVSISLAFFPFGERNAVAAQDKSLDEKLMAAYAVQSVKLLLSATEHLSRGRTDDSREVIVTHLGESLYFVRKGLVEGDAAYTEIASSLCPRLGPISEIAAGLPAKEGTSDPKVGANREVRRQIFSDALTELRKHCGRQRPTGK
jgi:hypothetical protein